MLGVTSGSELFWNKRDQTVRKENAMRIWIHLPFNENRKIISIQKWNFDLPWNYLKLSEQQLSSLKK